MDDLVINSHAFKHGLTADEIYSAWENPVARMPRRSPHEDQLVCVGVLPSGQLAQMIAAVVPDAVVVFHAMTPPQASVLKELGIRR